MEKENIIRALAICLFLMGSAAAVSIGAGPSTIDYGKLVKGGYAEQTVTVSTSGNEDLTCSIEFTGDIKDWMASESGSTFNLPANTRKILKIIIQPPIDATNGKYEGAIYLKAAPTSTITSGAGLIVGAGVKIMVSAEIVGKEDVLLTVESVTVQDTEVETPIRITSTITNNGNVRVNPNFTVDLLDQSGNRLLSGEYSDTSVLPTRRENLAFTLSSQNLQTGTYTASVNVLAKGQLIYNRAINFNMLPKGTFSVSGKLQEIKTSADSVAVGEPAKIMATFKNTGQATITAKFKAESYVNEKLTDIIKESDEMALEPGQTTDLETYYTPDKEGNYVIKGYVVYNGVKTEIKTTLLKVKNPETDNTLIYVVVAAILLAILAYYKFYKPKRREAYAEYPPEQADQSQYAKPYEATQQTGLSQEAPPITEDQQPKQ